MYCCTSVFLKSRGDCDGLCNVFSYKTQKIVKKTEKNEELVGKLKFLFLKSSSTWKMTTHCDY